MLLFLFSDAMANLLLKCVLLLTLAIIVESHRADKKRDMSDKKSKGGRRSERRSIAKKDGLEKGPADERGSFMDRRFNRGGALREKVGSLRGPLRRRFGGQRGPLREGGRRRGPVDTGSRNRSPVDGSGSRLSHPLDDGHVGLDVELNPHLDAEVHH